MTIDAPAFVPIGQPFTYRVIADDLANDPAYGVVVTIPIPASASASSVSADGWNCSVSSSQIRCSAEQMPPGPNDITVRLTAPPGVGSLAVGAAAMGVGGLLQAATGHRMMRVHRTALTAQWRTLAVAAPFSSFRCSKRTI